MKRYRYRFANEGHTQGHGVYDNVLKAPVDAIGLLPSEREARQVITAMNYADLIARSEMHQTVSPKVKDLLDAIEKAVVK